MKLTWWIYGDIDAYTIENPSKEFKKKYPKKYIIASIYYNRVFNEDSIEECQINTKYISYLFMYGKPLYGKQLNYIYSSSNLDLDLEKSSKKYIVRAIPVDLSEFFIGEPNDVDVLLKISPNTQITDPRFFNTIIFRTKTEELSSINLKPVLKSKLNKLFTDLYFDKFNTTEKWLTEFLNEVPSDLNDEPYKFPKILDDELFKKPIKVKLNDFAIGYSFRNNTIDQVEMVKKIETSFIKLNKFITIKNNYNNIAKKIMNQAKKNNIDFDIEYSKNSKDIISIKLLTNDFYKLNLKFKITDFIN